MKTVTICEARYFYIDVEVEDDVTEADLDEEALCDLTSDSDEEDWHCEHDETEIYLGRIE